MYSANGIMYTEEHSVSFGDINASNAFSGYNSWDSWHLIPSENIIIANPSIIEKNESRPGKHGSFDLTQYFGRTYYGLRKGEITFFADTNFLDLETLQDSLLTALNGRKLKMRLEDDPEYYYEGYFTLGQIEQGASYPTVQIGYQLNPYKIMIIPESTNEVTVSGNTYTQSVTETSYPLIPTVIWISGSVNVDFGGVTANLNSSGRVTLGRTEKGVTTLTASGTGRIKIEWRGGSL